MREPVISQLCEFHGARCGQLKCNCRRVTCSDCLHYRHYSGVLHIGAQLALPLKVNRVVEPAAPPAAQALPPEP